MIQEPKILVILEYGRGWLRNIDHAASIVLWTLASSPLAAAWHLGHDPSGEGIVDPNS